VRTVEYITPQHSTTRRSYGTVLTCTVLFIQHCALLVLTFLASLVLLRRKPREGQEAKPARDCRVQGKETRGGHTEVGTVLHCMCEELQGTGKGRCLCVSTCDSPAHGFEATTRKRRKRRRRGGGGGRCTFDVRLLQLLGEVEGGV